jgi:hypothetical protein
MSDTKAILRRTGRAGAIVAGGVMAMGAIATGTALASEPSGTTTAGLAPVDGFAAHWVEYHYGHDFVASEPKALLGSPTNYAAIHTEMAKEMLGLAPLPADPDPKAGGTSAYGGSGYGY